jgi:F420H(2)-dependent quinone reductase
LARDAPALLAIPQITKLGRLPITLQAIQSGAQHRKTEKPLMSRNLFFNIFRFFLAINVFLYRLSGGKFGNQVQGLPVLLLTTIGRKTGKRRITPLGFIEHDGCYVITATIAGFNTHPAWFHNLKSHPQVEVRIGKKQFTATAELASPALRQQLWAKIVERAPGYGAYEKRTTREIPVVLLRPAQKG